MLAADGMRLTGVLATHYHADHVGGDMMGYGDRGHPRAASAAPTSTCRSTCSATRPSGSRSAPACPTPISCCHDSGDVVMVGDIPIKLMHTPGHTPGASASSSTASSSPATRCSSRAAAAPTCPAPTPTRCTRASPSGSPNVPDDSDPVPRPPLLRRAVGLDGRDPAHNYVFRIDSLEQWRMFMGELTDATRKASTAAVATCRTSLVTASVERPGRRARIRFAASGRWRGSRNPCLRCRSRSTALRCNVARALRLRAPATTTAGGTAHRSPSTFARITTMRRRHNRDWADKTFIGTRPSTPRLGAAPRRPRSGGVVPWSCSRGSGAAPARRRHRRHARPQPFRRFTGGYACAPSICAARSSSRPGDPDRDGVTVKVTAAVRSRVVDPSYRGHGPDREEDRSPLGPARRSSDAGGPCRSRTSSPQHAEIERRLLDAVRGLDDLGLTLDGIDLEDVVLRPTSSGPAAVLVAAPRAWPHSTRGADRRAASLAERPASWPTHLSLLQLRLLQQLGATTGTPS